MWAVNYIRILCKLYSVHHGNYYLTIFTWKFFIKMRHSPSDKFTPELLTLLQLHYEMLIRLLDSGVGDHQPQYIVTTSPVTTGGRTKMPIKMLISNALYNPIKLVLWDCILLKLYTWPWLKKTSDKVTKKTNKQASKMYMIILMSSDVIWLMYTYSIKIFCIPPF